MTFAPTIRFDHPDGIRLPEDMTPGEIAFVGQLVSAVTRRGGHVFEVQRLDAGGLRIKAQHEDRSPDRTVVFGRRYDSRDVRLDGWMAFYLPMPQHSKNADKPSGERPVGAHDVAGDILQELGLVQ